jgi:hypothetical protein
MDMRDASAMTEASGLTDEQGGIVQGSVARSSARAEARDFRPVHSSSPDIGMRLADRLREVASKAPLQSLLVAFILGVWVARRR